MKKIIIALAVLSLSQVIYGQKKANNWDVDELANATVLIRRIGQPEGTGTIVMMDSINYRIFTAQHVAKNMDDKAVIVFSINNKSHQIATSLLGREENEPWYAHPVADIASLKIKIPAEDTIIAKHIKKWAFPAAQIYGGEESINQGEELDFFGYPLTDRKGEFFTPSRHEAKCAIGFITSKRDDTKQQCTFFFLSIPSIQGCSGSGVFMSVYKEPIWRKRSKTYMVGIIHGTQSDNTGGKMAAVTPLYYLKDALFPIKHPPKP